MSVALDRAAVTPLADVHADHSVHIQVEPDANERYGAFTVGTEDELVRLRRPPVSR